MKRFVLVFMGFILHMVAIAQEADQSEMENTARGLTSWSDDTKIIMLVIFGLTCFFFAARTFRNKPEA